LRFPFGSSASNNTSRLSSPVIGTSVVADAADDETTGAMRHPVTRFDLAGFSLKWMAMRRR
jgi:hypothetical protein